MYVSDEGIKMGSQKKNIQKRSFTTSTMGIGNILRSGESVSLFSFHQGYMCVQNSQVLKSEVQILIINIFVSDHQGLAFSFGRR